MAGSFALQPRRELQGREVLIDRFPKPIDDLRGEIRRRVVFRHRQARFHDSLLESIEPLGRLPRGRPSAAARGLVIQCRAWRAEKEKGSRGLFGVFEDRQHLDFRDAAIATSVQLRIFVDHIGRDEGLLQQNESIFDGLLRLSKEVDFGVFIWGASDVTISDGQSIRAARDNVVFETGLFLGALGKKRTFMVVDRSIPVKIPSDFEGISRTYYDSSVLGTYDRSAVGKPCNEIERNIRQRHVLPSLARLQGKWKSRFASGPFPDHPTMTDDVEIKVTAKGIHLTGSSGEFSYTGEGLIYYENQILGDWTHRQTRQWQEGCSCFL